MSNAAWRIRKRVEKLYGFLHDNGSGQAEAAALTVLDIIDEEIEREAEQQFTRPISKQAEMSQLLKENK